MSTPEKLDYLNEKQCVALSCKIAALLNGVSIGEARYILNEARHIIYDCHAINTDNPRFKAKLEEFAESGVFICPFCEKTMTYIPDKNSPFCEFCGVRIFEHENSLSHNGDKNLHPQTK